LILRLLRPPLALLLMAAALVAGPAPATAQQRRPLTVEVGGAAEQWRPVVRLRGVLREEALGEALESGLPLRFHFRVELWRKGTIDELVEARELSRAVLRAPLEEGYTLEDGRTQRPFATLAQTEAALEEAFQPPVRPDRGGRYYYLAVLNVETLSLSDLEELRRWLRGEARPAVEGQRPVGRAVESGLRRFFVRLLGLPARRYEVRSRSFTVPG
jgi:hypothetical protein